MIRLEQLRIERLLSREELADRAQVSAETIRLLELRTTTRPQMKTIRHLVEYFGVSATDLLAPVAGPAEEAAA